MKNRHAQWLLLVTKGVIKANRLIDFFHSHSTIRMKKTVAQL